MGSPYRLDVFQSIAIQNARPGRSSRNGGLVARFSVRRRVQNRSRAQFDRTTRAGRERTATAAGGIVFIFWLFSDFLFFRFLQFPSIRH